ncbi:MAG: tyrosine-type recombinase/integrase [Bacteroidota bacterium]
MSDLQYLLEPLDWTREFKRLLKCIEVQMHYLDEDKRRKLASYHTSIALGGYLAIHSKQLLSITWQDILNKRESDAYWNRNAAEHKVNFHAELLELVRRNYEICRPFASHYLVVSNPLKHQKPLIDRTYNNTLAQIMLKCGFDIGKEGSHILRKTGALRIYNEKGADPSALKYVSELLKHKSIGMTRTYLCLT